MHHSIQPSTLEFLRQLSIHNDREWFAENKNLYIAAYENMCNFIDQLIFEMNKHDEIENVSGKKSLYRIYNDVRFSKDKSPYNARFAFSLQRATEQKRGGYYLNIKPGNSFLACGFFAPNPKDLRRIRADIANNYKNWNKILNSKIIKSNFDSLRGSQVATVPRGFEKEHVAIDLIRNKQFILRHDFTDVEVTSSDYLTVINEKFKSVRPFFDMMSEVLTTNLDGESIL